MKILLKNRLCMFTRKISKNQTDLHVSKIQDLGRIRLESQPDQILINEWILTQLDAIGKCLTAIEKSSASAARPEAKKLLFLGVLLVKVSMGVLLRVIRSKNCQNCIP